MKETGLNIESKSKKQWQAPTLLILEFKKTGGGPEAGTTEDTYENDPVSGG